MNKEKILGQMSAKELLGLSSDLEQRIWELGREGASREEIEIRQKYLKAIKAELEKRRCFYVEVEKLSSSSYPEKYERRMVRIFNEFLTEAKIFYNQDENGLTIHPAGILALLDLVFYWGQNDFQAVNVPSVSVGDVIHWSGKTYRVASVGFERLTSRDYTKYLTLDSRDRSCFDTWRKLIK